MDRSPDPVVPPSVRAAQRARQTAAGRPSSHRGYAELDDDCDLPSLSAELAASKALLRAGSAEQVAAVVATLVHDLGGALVSARLADPAMTLPIDVSLGVSEPLLPFADPVSLAAMRLLSVLPEFLEDARMVLDRLQGAERRQDEATRDQLTGLLTRRGWMRLLSGASPGDGVCLIDLDHFKAVNDTGGHDAGDAVLKAVGGLLTRSFRDADATGRYGGDELVGLTPGMSAPALVGRCDRLRREWELQRPVVGAAVGLSIGVAEVDARGGRAALLAADAAMYRGKASGRNQTVLATEADWESS